MFSKTFYFPILSIRHVCALSSIFVFFFMTSAQPSDSTDTENENDIIIGDTVKNPDAPNISDNEISDINPEVNIQANSEKTVQNTTGTPLRRSGVGPGVAFGMYYYSEHFNDDLLNELGIDSVIGKLKSDEYGITPMFNASGGYYGKTAPFFLRGMIRAGGGIHTYDGSVYTSDSVNGKSVTTVMPHKQKKLNLFIGTALYGGPIFGNSKFLLGPCVGFHAEIWERLMNPDDAITSEEYRWVNALAGAHLRVAVSNRYLINAVILGRYIFAGKMEAVFNRDLLDMAEAQGYEMTIDEVTLGRRFGLWIELPMQFCIKPGLAFELAPWLEWRAFGKSNVGYMRLKSLNLLDEDVSDPFVEPSSDSFFMGLRFAVLFAH
jgi:hypothetical protein